MGVSIEKERIKRLYLESFDNSKWLIEHYQELTKEYNNKFVAVQNKKVIAVDVNPFKLLEKLKKMGVDISTVAIDFVTSDPLLYIL